LRRWEEASGRRSITINEHSWMSRIAIMRGRYLIGLSNANRQAAGVATWTPIQCAVRQGQVISRTLWWFDGCGNNHPCRHNAPDEEAVRLRCPATQRISRTDEDLTGGEVTFMPTSRSR
jgi:hypothetical protein